MNTLSRADIETTMNDLLAKNGQTTSQEVKTELRSKGFWATQAEVGPAMQDIADQSGIHFTFNGRFRTYTPAGIVPTIFPDDDEDDDTAAPVSPATPVAPPKVKTPPADPADREPLAASEPGCWMAYDVHSITPTDSQLFFKSTLTESQAKYAYTLKSDTLYTDVRTKRV